MREENRGRTPRAKRTTRSPGDASPGLRPVAGGGPERPMLLLLGALVAAALPLAPLAAGAALREG